MPHAGMRCIRDFIFTQSMSINEILYNSAVLMQIADLNRQLSPFSLLALGCDNNESSNSF